DVTRPRMVMRGPATCVPLPSQGAYASVLAVSVDVGIGDDLAFADQALHDLPDHVVQLLLRVLVQVAVHVRFALAAFDEGYLILPCHGAFYGRSAEKDPIQIKIIFGRSASEGLNALKACS